MQMLDHRLLADIGLSRSETEFAAAIGRQGIVKRPVP
jgi:uncharacterized protein YjiS (DUF1127 family)